MVLKEGDVRVGHGLAVRRPRLLEELVHLVEERLQPVLRLLDGAAVGLSRRPDARSEEETGLSELGAHDGGVAPNALHVLALDGLHQGLDRVAHGPGALLGGGCGLVVTILEQVVDLLGRPSRFS